LAFCNDIKSLALEAGFHAVGITSAEPFLDAEKVLGERRSSGLLDGPGHQPESFRVRTHPHECFPDARSIISVALSYLTDESSALDSHPHPSPLPPVGEGIGRNRDSLRPAGEEIIGDRDSLRPVGEGSIGDRGALPPAGEGTAGTPHSRPTEEDRIIGDTKPGSSFWRTERNSGNSAVHDHSSVITHHPSVPRGRVARFAWGLDYHRVLLERLSGLAESIGVRADGNVEIRCFADTPLLLDRPVAVRAGLGSYGKNACVYAGEYGSWVVLGELVTDIELDVDEPANEDICEDCEECMKACPTGAISAPYVIDRRVCLSQITQSKGFIPQQLREKMGTRIYGCDDCQSVCPLNRTARPGNIRELSPTEGIGESPELIPLLNISAEEFARIVKPTTAGWIGRTRFRRNVAVALGNTGDPAAEPALREALSDPEPIIRGHSSWALGRIGTPSARAYLEAAAGRETHEETSHEIRLAIDSY
jgi:epoxyqueuosine reductase